MDCQKYKDIIAAHVDGVLSPAELEPVELHLRQCRKCGQRFLWETGARKALKEKLTIIPVGAAFQERLRERIGESEDGSEWGLFSRFSLRHALIAAVAVLLLFSVPFLFLDPVSQEDVFAEIVAHYHKVAAGETGAPAEAAPPIPIARVLDLSLWGYHVLSRQSKNHKGMEGRVFVYEGRAKEFLVAREIEGADFPTPRNGRVLQASPRKFISYSQRGVNLIAWKEKDLLCVIASTIPTDELFNLAREIRADG